MIFIIERSLSTIAKENCALGLHQFGEWQNEERGQYRECAVCQERTHRLYPKPSKQYDPYAAL